MILAIGLPPALRTAIWALRIARVWIFTKSGIISPRRQPRRPSIGFCSCSDLIVASSSLSSSEAPPCSSARVTLTSCSSRLGRNSWSGGSISRMTTGSPSIALKMPSKSPCWRTSSLAIAASKVATASCSSAVSVSPAARLALARVAMVRDEDGAAHDLEAVALAEHVLRAAQADALGAVAAGLGGLLGLVGVGPDAHAADPVGPAEDLLELGLLLEPRGHGRAWRPGTARRSSRRG